MCAATAGGAGGAAGSAPGAGSGGAPPVAGVGGPGGTGGVGGGGGGTGGTGGTVAAGASWPQLGYDERSWYFNPTETTISVDNAAMLTQKWSFTVAGYPAGGVTIAEGKVFVTSTGGVYGLDLETGAMLWARTEPALASQSTPTYHDGHIYVHTYAMPGAQLFKLKASDGTTVWGDVKTYDHPGADGTSSPTIAAGKVMVGHSTPNEITPPPGNAQVETRGGVHAFDIATGQSAWHYWTTELPQNGAMVWSTVTVDVAAGEVYASTGNNYTVAGDRSDAIHAIDLATGMRKWHSQVRTGDTWTLGLNLGPDADTDFGANPIVAEIGGTRIVAAGDKGSDFWVLNRDTGQTLWRRENLTPSNFPAYGGILNNGAFDGTYFYVISNDPNASNAVLFALDPAQMGANAWPPITVPQVTWGMPSVANGVLFAPMNEELLVLNAHTGQELNRFNTGGSIAAGAAAIAGGKVVVKSGLQYPLDITQGTVMNNNKVICYGLP
jgi:outer membrane protein assembly factor BamB